MPLDFDKQLEMIGIVDRLVKAGEEVFNPKDARRLKYLIEMECGLKRVTSATRFADHTQSSSHKMQACAVGVGNVAIKDTEQKPVELGWGEKIMCGNWDIRLEDIKNFTIGIYRKFDETRDPRETEAYALMYDPNGAPRVLSKMVPKMIIILPWFGGKQIGFTRMGYETFKRQAPS